MPTIEPEPKAAFMVLFRFVGCPLLAITYRANSFLSSGQERVLSTSEAVIQPRRAWSTP